MKNTRFIIIAIIFYFTLNFSSAQNINWRSLSDEQTNLINLNVGWDYSSTIGIGYGHKLKTKIPIVVNGEFSMPFGNNLLDDFKTKLGGQAELLKVGNFSATAKVYGIYRRYENDFARLQNFGSEFSGVIGYYKPKWHIAGEFGFDKAIATHVKHSAIIKEYNPGLQSGWYVPTGGNFFYGIQTGISFKSNDAYLKIGKTVTEDFKSTATIPFYFQIGINRRF
ncbi:MAG: hypothetical protein ABI723_06685 [Bacteroidia bacterium]